MCVIVTIEATIEVPWKTRKCAKSDVARNSMHRKGLQPTAIEEATENATEGE